MIPTITGTLRKALRQLEAGKAQIDRQISAIRSVLQEAGGDRTRASHGVSARPTTTRRQMSAAARRAVSQRMKAYWAKRKAGAAKGKQKAKK
jgi:hypothetical protein